MSEVNKELVRRHFDEIWNQRNLAACEELMADDFVENAAAPFASASPGRVNGPAAMRETVAWLTTQFPDMRMELESVVAEGDIVVARVISRGTNLGQVDGGPPPLERHSPPVKVTGSESPRANCVSTGPREMTCQPCCNLG